jgi:pre-mRNA-splicing factor CDC5/CEF1
MRDELGLNDMDSMIVAGGKRAQQQRQAALRSDLRAGLSTLPTPQNEYQIEVPELPAGNDGMEDGEAVEEDAADAKVRRLREEEQRRLEEERKKSKVHLMNPTEVQLSF